MKTSKHVDLGEVAVERRRVGDGMHPVERVGKVDEPALLSDRCDRVGEGHAARDLLLQEEPDHLALAVGLDLLAGNDDEVAVARELDRLERAAERVVVGDRDRAEPDLLRVVEQLRGGFVQSCDQSVCVCRSTTIQSRPASGSPPSSERRWGLRTRRA